MAGIYIHVPFCTVKCAYCDFYSVARPDMADAYIDAVGKEYRARRHETGDAPINTLYIGGGTPSLLSPAQFAKLISYFDLGPVKEFTIEANPDDIDDAHVETWADCGVNRVSIGVQSLVDAELQAVGRRHNAGQAIEAIAKIQSHRIDNISGDLIYGLPGQTPDSFSYSLDTLLSTGIKHLSAYCLSYEEGTRLWRWLQQGRVAPTDDDIIAQNELSSMSAPQLVVLARSALSRPRAGRTFMRHSRHAEICALRHPGIHHRARNSRHRRRRIRHRPRQRPHHDLAAHSRGARLVAIHPCAATRA